MAFPSRLSHLVIIFGTQDDKHLQVVYMHILLSGQKQRDSFSKGNVKLRSLRMTVFVCFLQPVSFYQVIDCLALSSTRNSFVGLVNSRSFPVKTEPGKVKIGAWQEDEGHFLSASYFF